MGRGRLGNMHQKHPAAAAAAGGKACGICCRYPQGRQLMQRHNLALQRPAPLHTPSAPSRKPQGSRECLFKLVLMLYSSNPSERRKVSNKSHHREARGENGAALGHNPAGTGRIVGFIEAEAPFCCARAAEISTSHAFKQPPDPAELLKLSL